VGILGNAYITVGKDTAGSGGLHLYGGAAEDPQGGYIHLYNDADHDGTVTDYLLQAYSGKLYMCRNGGGFYDIVIDTAGKIGMHTENPSQYADLTLGDGVLCLAETTTPTANADYGKIYTKNTNKLFFQDGAGTEHEIALVT
jgi:hypothetical protein